MQSEMRDTMHPWGSGKCVNIAAKQDHDPLDGSCLWPIPWSGYLKIVGRCVAVSAKEILINIIGTPSVGFLQNGLHDVFALKMGCENIENSTYIRR